MNEQTLKLKLTNKLNILEQEIHSIRQQILKLLQKDKKANIIKKTAGLLQKKIPEGTKYQKRVREEFENHFKNSNDLSSR